MKLYRIALLSLLLTSCGIKKPSETTNLSNGDKQDSESEKAPFAISRTPSNSIEYSAYNEISYHFFSHRFVTCSDDFHLCVLENERKTIEEIIPFEYLDKVQPRKDEKYSEILDANEIWDSYLPVELKEPHNWYYFFLKCDIKDTYYLYKSIAENVPNACYLTFEPPGISGLGWKQGFDLPIGGVEQSMMHEATKYFDYDHEGFLEGYYQKFYVAISHELSLDDKVYGVENLLPYAVDEYDYITVNKLDDNSEKVTSLNETSFDENNRIKRDWYEVTFSYKFEARYAFWLYKLLAHNFGIYFISTEKCLDEEVEIKQPSFKIVYEQGDTIVANAF